MGLEARCLQAASVLLDGFCPTSLNSKLLSLPQPRWTPGSSLHSWQRRRPCSPSCSPRRSPRRSRPSSRRQRHSQACPYQGGKRLVGRRPHGSASLGASWLPSSVQTVVFVRSVKQGPLCSGWRWSIFSYASSIREFKERTAKSTKGNYYDMGLDGRTAQVSPISSWFFASHRIHCFRLRWFVRVLVDLFPNSRRVCHPPTPHGCAKSVCHGESKLACGLKKTTEVRHFHQFSKKKTWLIPPGAT